jgi:uroporphyrinogen-III synthase
MADLDDVAVLITRPEGQAAQLSGLFAGHGATVFRLPVMSIQPVGDPAVLRTTLTPPEPFDLILFTSTNAVRFGAPMLDRRRTPALAAIGPATARALAEHGFGGALIPSAGFDSESLLSDPTLTAAAGKRILIVTGLHGRELLQSEFVRRGAEVVVAAVYERRRVQPEADALASLEALLTAGRIDVVTATSTEIAGFVLDLATPRMRDAFESAHWLVPGARVAASLRGRGLNAPLLMAASATDQDLVDAVLRWRSSESGA